MKWLKINSYVVSVVFAQNPDDKKEYLFYSTKKADSPVNNLHRCSIHSDGYSSSSGIHVYMYMHVYHLWIICFIFLLVILFGMFRFFVDSKYLFASKENYTSATNIVSCCYDCVLYSIVILIARYSQGHDGFMYLQISLDLIQPLMKLNYQ